ncbi:copper homeostasis protein CutC [Persicobacter psychrovividus]|uniref:PF03932 family protein CutC n=1 Tax=Persicobacter psychrovividus TaxID=387638 RepID=A0ABM7VHQ1_9BACT|nr:copper homeostasis protein CutC [Persicobacter psychrovividus]
MKQLEICVYSLESALTAQANGADRVELCMGQFEGGITPSMGLIQQVKKHLTIGVNVIIRPRGGDFVYTPQEVEVMLTDIEMAKSVGADGVVFGALLPNGALDVATCQRLAHAAEGMDMTIHRAFDMSNDLPKALEALIEMGFSRVLTSGGYNTAPEGMAVLQQLVQQADGRLSIMAGSGVSADNAHDLLMAGIEELHLSAMHAWDSPMTYQNPQISMGKEGGIPEYTRYGADGKKVAAVRAIMDQFNQ